MGSKLGLSIRFVWGDRTVEAKQIPPGRSIRVGSKEGCELQFELEKVLGKAFELVRSQRSGFLVRVPAGHLVEIDQHDGKGFVAFDDPMPKLLELPLPANHRARVHFGQQYVEVTPEEVEAPVKPKWSERFDPDFLDMLLLVAILGGALAAIASFSAVHHNGLDWKTFISRTKAGEAAPNSQRESIIDDEIQRALSARLRDSQKLLITQEGDQWLARGASPEHTATATSGGAIGGLGGAYGNGAGNLGGKKDVDIGINSNEAVVLGSLDKEIIHRVIHQNRAQIRYCYEQQLVRFPKLEAKVVITFVIGPEGTVQQAKVGSSNSNNDELDQCLVTHFKSWQFPKPKGGGIVQVTYPVILKLDHSDETLPIPTAAVPPSAESVTAP
jgi:TonB family protein